MKNKIILTIGAIVFTMATFNLNASNAFVTPRAALNQIKVIASTGNDHVQVMQKGAATVLLTPRAALNQGAHVAGMEPVNAVKNNGNGTPKYITTAGNAVCTRCQGM